MQFDEGRCFLGSVEEWFSKCDKKAIQKKLLSKICLGKDINVNNGCDMIKARLSHRKVLIVLDDVDDIKQLKCLAGNCDWFGLGSRVIVTTRDKHLLVAHEVKCIYEVKTLENDQALQFFKQWTFKQNTLPEELFI